MSEIKLNSTFEENTIKIDFTGDMESFKQLLEKILGPFEKENADFVVRVKLNLKILELKND